MNKFCEFTSDFKRGLLNTAKHLGLTNVTSPIQERRNTIALLDPIAECTYLLYESGYIRRQYLSTGIFSRGRKLQYQLNRKNRVITTSREVSRVLAKPAEQYFILVNAVIRDRKKI
jgi:hypothetical protein